MKPTAQSVQGKLEIAPGERMSLSENFEGRTTGIVRWVPAGDGTFRPRVQIMEAWIRINDVDKSGFHIHPDTLLRLGRSAFIEIAEISPGQTVVCLSSLLDHCEKCQTPKFWNAARRAQYRTGYVKSPVAV